MSEIQYLIDKKDINKYEYQSNIHFNFYGYNDKKIFLLRITIVTTAKHHASLLYITAGET